MKRFLTFLILTLGLLIFPVQGMAAETWNTGVPALGHSPTADIPDMEENFAYLMACNGYWVDSSEPDQGSAGSGNSVKDLVDSIGTTKSATLFFKHHAVDGNTTTYTFSTNETIPSNITCIAQNGAILSIDSGVTLTINGSFEAGLYRVFSGDGSVNFGTITEVYPEWWGALNDITIDSYAALATMISDMPAYASVRLNGIYLIESQLVITKSINLLGNGVSSGFYLGLDTSTDGILYGDVESGASTVKHSMWSSFGIYGDTAACRNALVLTGMLQNEFEGVHVMAGTHATGYGVWARWCQSNHRMNFIMGQFNSQYPIAVTVPSNGFKATSSADIATVFIDNKLDVIIEGMSGKGIYLYNAESSLITGLSEGITDHALHLKDGSYNHITNFYTETVSATADENEIYIEGGSSNILGPGVFSIPGAPANVDVKIVGATDTKIDGLFCSILSIDATSVNTKIGQITTTGQTGSGIIDAGINTSQLNADAQGYQGTNTAGLFSDFSSIITNGSFERWIDANTVAGSSWSFIGAGVTETRETTIKKHGVFSCKVDITGGTSAKFVRLNIPTVILAANPRGRMTVTGWIYIPTANGQDISVSIYYDDGAATVGAGGAVARDAWTKVSFTMDNTLAGAHSTSAYLHIFNAAATDCTFYLDGWSVVPGVAGGASWFTPNANEFPKYTGVDTWDPGSIAAGGHEQKSFTVLAAALGMVCIAGNGVSLGGDFLVSAQVVAADTVGVTIYNMTAGAIDLASSTWRVVAVDISN